jgi:hypothetical protein
LRNERLSFLPAFAGGCGIVEFDRHFATSIEKMGQKRPEQRCIRVLRRRLAKGIKSLVEIRRGLGPVALFDADSTAG